MEKVSPEEETLLTSFREKTFVVSGLVSFLGNCCSVDQYKKLNRVGEGTYGIVKCFL
jgi:hypothetical protein